MYPPTHMRFTSENKPIKYDCSRISSLVQSLQKEVKSEPVSELVPNTSVRAQPVRPSQNCHMDNVIQRTPTEERKSVDILGEYSYDIHIQCYESRS